MIQFSLHHSWELIVYEGVVMLWTTYFKGLNVFLAVDMENTIGISSGEDDLEWSISRTTVVNNLTSVSVTFCCLTKWDILNLTLAAITSYMTIMACLHINIQCSDTGAIACVSVVDWRAISTCEPQIEINLGIIEKSDSQSGTNSTNGSKNIGNSVCAWSFWLSGVPFDPCEVLVSVGDYCIIWSILCFIQCISCDVEDKLSSHGIVLLSKRDWSWFFSFTVSNTAVSKPSLWWIFGKGYENIWCGFVNRLFHKCILGSI